MTAKAPVRHCAVYTRKSSEEGLEQDFNSLHAQREAGEAFIRSQRGEGWRLIETAYDDGGLSGGTLDPASQSAEPKKLEVENEKAASDFGCLMPLLVE